MLIFAFGKQRVLVMCWHVDDRAIYQEDCLRFSLLNVLFKRTFCCNNFDLKLGKEKGGILNCGDLYSCFYLGFELIMGKVTRGLWRLLV